MLNHVGPKAASELAQQFATKYQVSSEASPDAAAAAYMAEVETVLDEPSVVPSAYLTEASHPLKMELAALGADHLSLRRKEFFEAILGLMAQREVLI